MDVSLWSVFAQLVREKFAFLSSEFGYRLTSERPPFVEYEGNGCSVVLYFSQSRHHAVDVTVRRLSDDTKRVPAVSLSEMGQISEAGPSYVRSEGYAVNLEELESEVGRLAVDLKKYGAGLLEGRSSDWERVYALRRDAARKMADL